MAAVVRIWSGTGAHGKRSLNSSQDLWCLWDLMEFLVREIGLTDWVGHARGNTSTRVRFDGSWHGDDYEQRYQDDMKRLARCYGHISESATQESEQHGKA